MFWKKPSLPDIQFVDTTRITYQAHPIVPARECSAFFQKTQIDNQGKYKWAECPGMIDYKNFGYIITAWDDIHIIANRAGVKTIIGGNHQTPFNKPKHMDSKICEGIIHPEDGVPLSVIHCGSPWSIIVNNKNISAAIMPAIYHSPFLDDLYIYPGLVDYTDFSIVNFIFSPKRECQLTIQAGTPLLQVLPFETKHIKAGYGPADIHQVDKTKSMMSSAKQFYRKHYQQKKPTSISLDTTKDFL